MGRVMSGSECRRADLSESVSRAATHAARQSDSQPTQRFGSAWIAFQQAQAAAQAVRHSWRLQSGENVV